MVLYPTVRFGWINRDDEVIDLEVVKKDTRYPIARLISRKVDELWHAYHQHTNRPLRKVRTLQGTVNDGEYPKETLHYDPNEPYDPTYLSNKLKSHILNWAFRNDDYRYITVKPILPTGLAYDRMGLEMATPRKRRTSLPALEYTYEEIECPICQGEVEDGTGVRIGCGHTFHENCLSDWHGGNTSGVRRYTCPTCRQSLSLGRHTFFQSRRRQRKKRKNGQVSSST